ncbi:DUF6998 domain-containing protein [Guyparkeria sp.]|uniref:DUF6998 domain-containing protein n=1 Tax=Guyparkeria sp. TaxID=2035736 RepID=UPI003564FBEA
MDRARLPELIGDLYRIVGELEEMFPGRHFTPDGHLVGSLGECLAAYHYGLELLRASSPGVDAVKNGLGIEIKATQANRVGLRSGPEHLLVLRLDREGGFSEVYNGPGHVVWREFEGKKKPSNGQFQISLSRLAKLMEGIPSELRLPMTTSNQAIHPSLK